MPLRFNGSTSGYVELNAPAAAGNNTLVLPTGNGTNGQVLTTNGSGALSWATPSTPPDLYYRLSSDRVGSNVTSVQSVFGVGVTVQSGVLYSFSGHYLMQKSVGGTAHALQTAFGGTATVSAIEYTVQGTVSSNDPTASNYGWTNTNTTSAVQVTQTGGNATMYGNISYKGVVSFSSAGTFIPQYALTVAPGGAYTMKTGSYFEMMVLSTSNANSKGTWS